jgi:hypothetical protein
VEERQRKLGQMDMRLHHVCLVHAAYYGPGQALMAPGLRDVMIRGKGTGHTKRTGSLVSAYLTLS